MKLLEAFLSGINRLVWNGPMLFCLFASHLYFTLHTGFVQRKLGKGIRQSLGKSSSFMTLTTTLAATLGTGNIIGVSSAIFLGGPGALFWCFLTGLLGMATTYAECYISILHRTHLPDGKMTGGPMYVLSETLHHPKLGLLYAFAVIAAAYGMGCSTQSHAFVDAAASLGLPRVPVSIMLAALIGLVIFGGARRIHRFCMRLVPVMGGIFLFCCLLVLIRNIEYLFDALSLMFRSAFSVRAVTAGTLSGSLMTALRFGVARGLFTNEAGLGTAAIASADNDAPAAEAEAQALVSMSATFWDTVVLCSITGLAILTTAISHPELLNGYEMNDLTSAAFLRLAAGGPALLNLCLMAFAFATLTGWSYFGEKAILYLFRKNTAQQSEPFLLIYKIGYLIMIFLGAMLSMQFLWELTDFANLFLAIPSLYALFCLRQKVRSD